MLDHVEKDVGQVVALGCSQPVLRDTPSAGFDQPGNPCRLARLDHEAHTPRDKGAGSCCAGHPAAGREVLAPGPRRLGQVSVLDARVGPVVRPGAPLVGPLVQPDPSPGTRIHVLGLHQPLAPGTPAQVLFRSRGRAHKHVRASRVVLARRNRRPAQTLDGAHVLDLVSCSNRREEKHPLLLPLPLPIALPPSETPNRAPSRAPHRRPLHVFGLDSVCLFEQGRQRVHRCFASSRPATPASASRPPAPGTTTRR